MKRLNLKTVSLQQHDKGSWFFAVVVIVVLALALPCMAASTLELPGTTSRGLGGAAVAISDGLGAMLRNPAALSHYLHNEVALEVHKASADVQVPSLALVQRNQNGFSGGLIWLSYKNNSALFYHDLGYVVSAGSWDGTSVGAGFHLIMGENGLQSKNGWVVDAGLVHQTGLLRLGVSRRGVYASGITKNEDWFPRELRAGMAIEGDFAGLAIDALQENEDDKWIYMAGVWVQLGNARINLGARQTDAENPDKLRYGASLSIPLHNVQVNVATEFVPDKTDNQYLPINVGLSYCFP